MSTLPCGGIPAAGYLEQPLTLRILSRIRNLRTSLSSRIAALFIMSSIKDLCEEDKVLCTLRTTDAQE
jgi:hypothetical protein